MIKIDENDPIGEMDPSFPFRDVVIRKNTDMKEFYDLQKEIGRGKFGTVYRCTEKSTGLKLAAKFIGISKRQDRRNAEREVEIMRELQHPRLIQMYDAFEINNIMCVVLELIEGGELFERVIDDDFILTEKSVSVFMRQICEGIAFIHSKNILHLDMKPENILCLTRTGNRIKIIDFGLARKYDPEKKLQVLFGTPEFVAPEVVNFDSIGFGTDMWSVGVICYVLLSGLSPFMGETDVQTMANVTIAQYDFDDEAFNDISADAKDFIGKLLLKDREQRMSATECLSHRWLQRRKPPISSSPPCNSIPQSELDLQKDTLRYLVDRWNNDTNISLVMNNDDDKCEKVIDICKMNGIAEQQSKSRDGLVCKMTSSPANDHTTEQSVIKLNSSSSDTANESSNLDNVTLVPIQSIEAPPVSNQELKSLSDVTSMSRLSPNLKRSLSPDTAAVEVEEKEHNAKISKSLTPSKSGSCSPLVCEKHLSNGEVEVISDESSQELPKSTLLEVPGKKSPQKQSSTIKKSPSTSPKLKKKTPSKASSPLIDDHLPNGKDEQMNSEAKMATDKLSERLPKSPSLLEVPNNLSQNEPTKTVKKSPSTSPKPLKKTVVKTPSPTIKDQDQLIPNHIDNYNDESSQQRSEEPKNPSQVESTTVKKSPSVSPIPSKKTVVKTPSPTVKNEASNLQEEVISNHTNIANDKPSQQISETPKNLSQVELTTFKKSPSVSPIPSKKTIVRTPTPIIKDQESNQQDQLISNCTGITNDKPSQLTMEMPKNASPIKPKTIEKSPSTSPTPLKKTVVKTPPPTINDLASNQQCQLVPNCIEITNDKSSQVRLEIPKNISQVHPSVEKSPSTSPVPAKKTVVRTPSPIIKDQASNQQGQLISNHTGITNDKPSKLTLKMPENISSMEPATIKKSSSLSPTPQKKKVVKTPSPSTTDLLLNHQDQSIDLFNIADIKLSQESSSSSLLEIPKKLPSTETSSLKKSPSTSPKPLKKKVAKTPSPSIKDQPLDCQDVTAKSSLTVTLERSPPQNILKDRKSPITVPHNESSTESNVETCDIVKETPIVNETNISINSKDKTCSQQSECVEGTSREKTTKCEDKLQDIPSPETSSQSQPRRTPIVEISDETYECVKKRRFTIKSVESTKTIHKDDSTSQIKSREKISASSETTPQPHRRSIFSPDVSPKVLRKLNDFMSSSELMKRRISDISNLLSRKTEKDVTEQSIPDDMSSFCSKLNRIVRLRHDSYSIDGSSSNVKRPKFRISYLSRDVPLASTPPLHADLLNYLPFGDESISTPVWSFQRNNPFHSDPSSLRNSPERFASPSLTRRLLSKFFNDSLDYDISPTPSTSTNGLPKDKITGIIS